ncbi:Aspartic peptidase [Heracleum sosnowskyi]|uniref:Aspartic peptidase n=1 Tax=Heracleum sosnowskyi TaxID=360622 RepID=A0AAD8HR98_9APIA|nr:Aspartic peptidase [Heracleum sosnowskyi]
MNLGGPHTWFDCDAYKLPTYKPLMCGSKKCTEYNAGSGCMRCVNPHTPGCTDDSCGLNSYNAFEYRYEPQSLGEDALFAVDTNGVVAVGITYETPEPFAFTCSDANLLRGLSNETKGMLGLANTTTSLHAQLSTQFKIPRKFALCFVDVTYIKVDHKPVSFNSSLLSINEDGYGGTLFSTITPYTKLETSIYEGLVSAFTKAAAFKKMKRVSSVAPFGACYKAKTIAKSQTGPVVPYIDIGLAGNTHWRFYGANSMVAVKKDVLCLAFVDAGILPRTSIVIGGHQMENYLIEFDHVSSKLGISTSLLFRNTTFPRPRRGCLISTVHQWCINRISVHLFRFKPLKSSIQWNQGGDRPCKYNNFITGTIHRTV